MQRRKNRNSSVIYAAWAIPNDALVPLSHVNASTWIRHNSTPAERVEKHKHHRRRTRALSVFPETTQQFKKLFGLREDVESANSHLKDLLTRGRARTVGAKNVQLDLVAHQTVNNIVATAAFSKRTHRSTSRWFGGHPLNPGGSPFTQPVQQLQLVA